MKVKLGDIAVLINGDRGRNYPSQADIVPNGDIPFVNAGHLNGKDINFDEMNYISQEKFDRLNSGKFCKGDILYCLRGSLGKKAVVRDIINGAIASSLVIIRPNAEKVNVDYLMFALDSQSIQEQIIKANNGSSQPNLSAASVRGYDIDLPERDVQEEVVAKLSKVSELIDLRKRQLSKLDELVKSQFIEMFGNMSDTIISSTVTSLGSVCDVRDGTHDSPKYHDDGYPLVTSKNVTGGFLDFSGCNLISQDDYEKIIKRSRVDRGDIIMPMIGTVGKPIIVDTDREFAIKNVALIKFNANSAVNNVFVKCLLESDYFDRTVMEKVQGGNQKFISLGDLRGLPLVIPEADVQEQFRRFVEQSDKSKVVVQQSLDKLETLKKSLMQEYFG